MLFWKRHDIANPRDPVNSMQDMHVFCYFLWEQHKSQQNLEIYKNSKLTLSERSPALGIVALAWPGMKQTLLAMK